MHNHKQKSQGSSWIGQSFFFFLNDTDLSEDPEIKQRILDLKDEIETKKASRRPGSSRRLKHNSRK